MSIIKNKDIYDPSQGDPLEPLYKLLEKLDGKIEVTKNKMNVLEKSIKDVNKTGSGAEAKQLIDNTQKLQIETGKLNNLQGARSKIDTVLKTNQEILNRQTKENVRLKSQLTGAYEKESIKLNQLRRAYKDLAVQEKGATKEGQALLKNIQALDAKLKKVDASAGQFHRSVGNYKSALQNLGASIKNFFLAGGIVVAFQKMAALVSDSRRLAGELAGVKVAFDKIATPGLLDELRASTKGTISDLELMKQAVKASEFNIPIEKMGSMMQFASMQAQKMGESVDFMAESITTGLARGSVMILDNLGISAKELREEMQKTGDLTEAAFNVINKKIAESGGIIETSEIITARWGARWENIKASAGGLLDTVLVKISPVLESIWEWLNALWKNSTKFIIDTYNGFVDLYNESKLFRSIIESIGLTFDVLWETVKLFFSAFTGQLKTIGKTLAYTFNPANWGKDFKKGLAEILAAQGGEIINNFKRFGTRIGEETFDAINNTMAGELQKMNPEDFLFGGGTGTKPKLGATGGGGATVTKTGGTASGGGILDRFAAEEAALLAESKALAAEELAAKQDLEAGLLQIEIDNALVRQELREKELQEIEEFEAKKRDAIGQTLEEAGAAFGELLASGELSYKEFGRFLVKTALDVAEKMLLFAIAEIWFKNATTLSGIAKAAILTGLAKGVFSTLKSQVQNFADGTERVTGPGTERSDSIPANLSVNERILSAKDNKPLLKWGIPNNAVAPLVGAGLNSLQMQPVLASIAYNTEMTRRYLQHGRNDWTDNGFKYWQEWNTGTIKRRKLND